MQYELSLGSRYSSEKSLSLTSDTMSSEDKYFSFLLSADLYQPLNQFVDFNFSFYSGKLRIDKNDIGDYSLTSNDNAIYSEFKSNDLFINELYFGKEINDIFKYFIGKQLTVVGNGFIIGDYQYSVASSLNLFSILSIDLELLYVDFKSPLINSGIILGNKDEDFIEIGASYFNDKNNSLANIITTNGSPILLYSLLLSSKIPISKIPSRIEEITGEEIDLSSGISYIELAREYLDLTDKSNQYWTYIVGEMWLDDWLLEGTAILNQGSSRFNYNSFDLESNIEVNEEKSVNNIGYLYNIGFSHFFTEDLKSSLYFLHSSGDEDLQTGLFKSDINSFISIYPYITHSNIFFSGGLDSLISEKGLILSGIDGKGVVSPKVSMEYDNDKIMSKVGLIYLFSEESNNESRNIGPEIDFEFSWQIFKYFEFLFEADFLLPQQFWGEDRESMIYNVLVGFNVIWNNSID